MHGSHAIDHTTGTLMMGRGGDMGWPATIDGRNLATEIEGVIGKVAGLIATLSTLRRDFISGFLPPAKRPLSLPAEAEAALKALGLRPSL